MESLEGAWMLYKAVGKIAWLTFELVLVCLTWVFILMLELNRIFVHLGNITA